MNYNNCKQNLEEDKNRIFLADDDEYATPDELEYIEEIMYPDGPDDDNPGL